MEEVAEVKPGCYSGINDFFYLTKKEVQEFEIEQEYLLPIIRTSRQIEYPIFNQSSNIDLVLFCHSKKEELKKLKHLGVLKYIEWGETQVTRQRQKTASGIPWPQTETVKRRKPGWWAIPEENLKTTQLFMLYVINDRFLFPFSNKPICSDRCLHRILPIDHDYGYFAAILNSTVTWFMISLMGRAGLGQGALKYEAKDAKNLLVFDSKAFPTNKKTMLLRAFEQMGKRKIYNVFDEIGIDLKFPIREQTPNPLPDRKALDNIVFDILGFTQEERNEVYWAVCDLVRNRMEKARSVKRNE